jgi:hypothetical protein
MGGASLRIKHALDEMVSSGRCGTVDDIVVQDRDSPTFRKYRPSFEAYLAHINGTARSLALSVLDADDEQNFVVWVKYRRWCDRQASQR